MSYRRCEKCRTREDRYNCEGYPYYLPRDIQYCRAQVMWLISYSELLDDGRWPPDPEPTGYVGIGLPVFRSEAYFVVVKHITAPLNQRLKRAGKDGETLVHEIMVIGTHYYKLAPVARDALNYCTGRDKGNYAHWLANRRYRAAAKL